MSFLFRRNNSKNTSTHNLPETSEFVKEIQTLKRQFRDNRRKEIVDKFVNRVKILFETIIKTESEKGNYNVARNDLTISNSNFDLLTDEDRISISDSIKKEFSGYYVSLKINTNSVDVLMKWETADEKDTFWTEAYNSKMIADNYNKLPYLVDEVTEKTKPVELPEEVIEHILDQIKTSVKSYGSIPRQYYYKFPHVASTNEENSDYRETMNKVIENLPAEFHSVKGSFQRTSKNAIVSFILEFIIDINF